MTAAGDPPRRPVRTRVVESTGDPGKWQAQYWDHTLRVWCDIGDAQAHPDDAVSRETAYRQEQAA